MKSTLLRLGLLALFISALAGCGGGGSDGVSSPVSQANSTTPGVIVVGANAVTVNKNSDSPTAEALAAWKALAPQVSVQSVTIASPTVVKFTVTDANGRAILGLTSKSQGTASTSSSVAALTNIGFTLAKLVPGTYNAPSKWVSYNVVRPPTVAEKAAAPTVAWYGTYPATDTQGTLVDNGDGSYMYTFYRDPKQAKAIVDGLVDDATALKFKADLDPANLVFDATATYRLGIQIGGAAPGSGSNTPTAVNYGNGVNMVNTANVVVDFRPDGGAVSSTRNIAKIDSCNDCHNGKVLAHGSRKDPQYCVTCHTDQIKYSMNAEATTTTGPGGLILNGTKTSTTSVVDGRALGNFPNLIHKMHLGAELVKTGYNFIPNSTTGIGVNFNEVKFPQDQRNCTKCHDGEATDVNKKTADGNNWKMVPNRLACGACHDGINFATGTGTNLSGATAGHGTGGAQANDTACSTCHTPAAIAVYHIPVTPANTASALHVNGGNANTNAASIASNTSNLPAGAIKVTYDILSVSRNASKQPVMVFRLLQNGARADFNDKTTKTEIWDNFMGAPSVYFVFAVPQDGISKPADFNASASSYLRSLWNGVATGTSAGTLTGPDGSGYYTATLTGVTVPDSAVMLTGGLGYTYSVINTMPLTQTNVAGYPVTAATATTGLTTGMPNKIGGLLVVAPDAQKIASAGASAGGTGGAYTGRRAIVDDTRCNKCHQELGVFTKESFHAGQRNDGPSCSWCHNPNRTSSGWSADSTSFIHGIHGGLSTTGVTSSGKNKRVAKFTWHAVSATDGFWDIGYPGVLKNCETCHLPGTYDFSASTSSSALPNRLYRTVTTGTIASGTISAPTYTGLGDFAFGTNFGSGFSFNAGTGATTAAATTTLVTSPIAAACFSCHDTTSARSHMEDADKGGSIYRTRGAPGSGALAKTENCMFCHGPNDVLGIKAVHDK